MNKPKKIDENTWHYRGFTICRNYTSAHGTRRVCSSQQGYRTTPQTHSTGGIHGDWTSTLCKAVERIDGLHKRYEAGELQYTTRAAVEQAIKIEGERALPPENRGVTVTLTATELSIVSRSAIIERAEAMASAETCEARGWIDATEKENVLVRVKHLDDLVSKLLAARA